MHHSSRPMSARDRLFQKAASGTSGKKRPSVSISNFTFSSAWAAGEDEVLNSASAGSTVPSSATLPKRGIGASTFVAPPASSFPMRSCASGARPSTAGKPQTPRTVTLPAAVNFSSSASSRPATAGNARPNFTSSTFSRPSSATRRTASPRTTECEDEVTRHQQEALCMLNLIIDTALPRLATRLSYEESSLLHKMLRNDFSFAAQVLSRGSAHPLSDQYSNRDLCALSAAWFANADTVTSYCMKQLQLWYGGDDTTTAYLNSLKTKLISSAKYVAVLRSSGEGGTVTKESSSLATSSFPTFTQWKAMQDEALLGRRGSGSDSAPSATSGSSSGAAPTPRPPSAARPSTKPATFDDPDTENLRPTTPRETSSWNWNSNRGPTLRSFRVPRRQPQVFTHPTAPGQSRHEISESSGKVTIPSPSAETVANISVLRGVSEALQLLTATVVKEEKRWESYTTSKKALAAAGSSLSIAPPWPVDSVAVAGFLLDSHPNQTSVQQTVANYLKQQQRKWHPDRFCVAAGFTDQQESIATLVSQNINSLKDRLAR